MTFSRIYFLLSIAFAIASGAKSASRFARSTRFSSANMERVQEWLNTAPIDLTSMMAAANNSVVNVYDYGAVGDGQTDDTGAFQAALNDMGQNGNGGIVFLPRGEFRFAGSLNVPDGVTMEGIFRFVPSHRIGGTGDSAYTGSVLLPTAGQGNENAQPFITLGHNSALRGVTIYHPLQNHDSHIDMAGDNSAVSDVEVLNSWNAIRAVGAARHYIARVQGQPLNIGVFIDQTYDIGRVENVHFNPWYSQNKALVAWQLTYGRAFVVARSDWEYFFNTFAFGYAVGYHFVESASGSCNGNFLGIGADMCPNASVLVDSADPWGIMITNGEFTSFIDPNWGTTNADSTQVIVSPSNSGSVRFVNSAFWGPSHQIANIQGSGTVGFGDCTFNYWDAENQGRYAITVAGTGSVLVRGCDFQYNGNQVEIQSSVQRAVIVGNLITGSKRVYDHGCGDLEMGYNANN